MVTLGVRSFVFTTLCNSGESFCGIFFELSKRYFLYALTLKVTFNGLIEFLYFFQNLKEVTILTSSSPILEQISLKIDSCVFLFTAPTSLSCWRKLKTVKYQYLL